MSLLDEMPIIKNISENVDKSYKIDPVALNDQINDEVFKDNMYPENKNIEFKKTKIPTVRRNKDVEFTLKENKIFDKKLPVVKEKIDNVVSLNDPKLRLADSYALQHGAHRKYGEYKEQISTKESGFNIVDEEEQTIKLNPDNLTKGSNTLTQGAYDKVAKTNKDGVVINDEDAIMTANKDKILIKNTQVISSEGAPINSGAKNKLNTS